MATRRPTMRRIVRETVLYQCRKCKTVYSNARDAKRCESGSVEEKKFKKGDQVRLHTPRRHACYDILLPNVQKNVGNKTELVFNEGVIINVSRPRPFDPEYMVKGPGDLWPKGQPSHVFEYKVVFKFRFCPGCGANLSTMFFSPEVSPLRRRK